MSSNTSIEATVNAILKTAGVSFIAAYRGETERTSAGEKPWKCDEWSIAISRPLPQGNRISASMHTSYYTGLGHRGQDNWGSREPKPILPTAADVLHSLIIDASAAQSSFSDWCSDLGYSDDSIKAFQMYQECCTIGKQLRAIFTAPELRALAEATQDL